VDVSLGFLIGCFRRTQYIPELGVFYKNLVGCGEGVCEGYKYLHLTGLWLGMMDRINATDRNVYSIPHSSSPFFLFLIYTDQKNQPIAIKVTMMIIKSLQTICSISDILSLRTHSETIENSFNRKK